MKRYYFAQFGDDHQWGSLGDDGFTAAGVLKDRLIEALDQAEDGEPLTVRVKTETLDEEQYLAMQDY